ncbi:MAG TPA: hypothetical protein VEW68_06490, partial [Patescibacteria group bacterium]|nr:hypothetical protein [Patescibacteria group bacterium]
MSVDPKRDHRLSVPGSDEPPAIVLKEVYDLRFSRSDQAAKQAIWQELGRFLQRYIKPDARGLRQAAREARRDRQ